MLLLYITIFIVDSIIGASLFSDQSLGLIRAISFRPEKIRSGLPFLMRAIASFILCLLSV
jgi:hypothetical protein